MPIIELIVVFRTYELNEIESFCVIVCVLKRDTNNNTNKKIYMCVCVCVVSTPIVRTKKIYPKAYNIRTISQNSIWSPSLLLWCCVRFASESLLREKQTINLLCDLWVNLHRCVNDIYIYIYMCGKGRNISMHSIEIAYWERDPCSTRCFRLYDYIYMFMSIAGSLLLLLLLSHRVRVRRVCLVLIVCRVVKMMMMMTIMNDHNRRDA